MAVTINKNLLLLAAAIALGGAAFYLSNRAITSRISQIEEEATRGKTLQPVVVANRPLQAGEVIDTSSVSVRQIPAEFVNKNMVTPDSYDSVDGQALLVDMERGDPLQFSYTASRGGEIFAATLKSGRRALTIEVDEVSSISGMLRPGDHIDLMLTAQAGSGTAGGGSREVTFPLLSNVEVLATGQAQKGTASTAEANARAYAHVTLDVTPEDATRIITAKAGGRLTAVLRAPNDQRLNSSQALTIEDVVAPGTSGGIGAGRGIEFLIGGAGGSGTINRTPVLDAVMHNPTQKMRAEAVAAQLMNEKPAAIAPVTQTTSPASAPSTSQAGDRAGR